MIRNKIRLAIQDMPQIDEVRELLQRNGMLAEMIMVRKFSNIFLFV